MRADPVRRFSWLGFLKNSGPALLLGILLAAQGCALDNNGFAKTREKTYQNPLLEKFDMADPHVIRVGSKYYLYPTSHTRGYDAFVSEDLVHWAYKGNVFKDARGGDWAPDVFHNKRGDGKFYLYYTDNPAEGDHSVFNKQIGVAVANSPLGPFVDKGSLCHPSIDAHLFQDEDGRFYLYYVDLSQGSRIMVQPMADLLTKQGEPKEVIRPTEGWERQNGDVTEGPFMLKRNGVYYLMYSGTGADSPNYGIGYATATSPLGPFEKYRGNPIVKRTDKILGPGHHSVVEGPDGKMWMIYHQKRTEEISFKRFLAIDPIWFDEQGVLHATASLREKMPAP